MPNLTFPRSALGAVVQFAIAPRHAQPGIPAPKVGPTQVRLLVDTGADRTTLHESLLQPWAISPTSFGWRMTADALRPARLYEIDLQVLGPSALPVLRLDRLLVSTTDSGAFDDTPYKGLLGRDVLDQGLFIYNGANSHCTLAF